MGNASFSFLAFAAAVVIAYNANGSPSWRRAVLLIANFAFLASFTLSPAAWIPFAAFLAGGYLLVRAFQDGRIKTLAPTIIGMIAVFIWIKKYTFLPGSLFLGFSYTTIGLSYIFFRLVHLIVDARSGNLPEIGLVSYLNYTLNFTTLVSGPIQRYQDFASMQQHSDSLPLTPPVVGEALERIIVGFFKANVLSLLFSQVQRREIWLLSGGAGSHPVLAGIAVAAAYPLFLYCNFSGYIDVVIGIARLLGLRLPENFNRPFSADSFLNFWSRWHITLSEWLKTYIYNPMLMFLMTRLPSPATEPFLGVAAFFFTFSVVGVWHGQTSEFVFFGILQGLGVSVNKLYQIVMTRVIGRKRYKALSADPVYNTFSRGLTFTWFAFTLIWFWSNWGEIAALVRVLGYRNLLFVWVAIFFGSTAVLSAWELVRHWTQQARWGGQPLFESPYVRTVWDTALLTAAAAVTVLLRAPAPEIVYKGF